MMLPWILLALSAGLGIWGAVSQGNAEREQARTNQQRAEVAGGWNDQQQQWNKQQIDWAIDEIEDRQEDLTRQAGRDDATLLTQSAASGIMGPMVDQARGYTAGEYNRAIGRLQDEIWRNETRKGWVDTQGQWADIQQQWGIDDYQSLIDQSYVNQYFNIGSTLLTGVQGGYALGVDQNLWGPGKFNPVSGEVVKPYFNQPKATRGSLYDWYGSYGGVYR